MCKKVLLYYKNLKSKLRISASLFLLQFHTKRNRHYMLNFIIKYNFHCRPITATLPTRSRRRTATTTTIATPRHSQRPRRRTSQQRTSKTLDSNRWSVKSVTQSETLEGSGQSCRNRSAMTWREEATTKVVGTAVKPENIWRRLSQTACWTKNTTVKWALMWAGLTFTSTSKFLRWSWSRRSWRVPTRVSTSTGPHPQVVSLLRIMTYPLSNVEQCKQQPN